MVNEVSHQPLEEDTGDPPSTLPGCIVGMSRMIAESISHHPFRCDTLSASCPNQRVKVVMQPTLADILRMKREKDAQGNWVPANGGTETAFRTRMGRRLLYCWQPSTGDHRYLDCDTDLLLSDEEARLALGI